MKSKENSEKIKQLISNFLSVNSYFGRRAEFANMIFHQPYKKYFILKGICGGNIIGGIPYSDVSIPQLANPILPLKIIQEKNQDLEFKNFCNLIFKIFETKQYGISYDDAIRYLNELYQNSHNPTDYYSCQYLSEIKQKLTRFNDFNVKRQLVKMIYDKIRATREEYVKKSLVSYSLTKYIFNERPTCSGQTAEDAKILNYYYVCSSESSECRHRNTNRSSARLETICERLSDTEDNSQSIDVPISRATQALQRIILYGFDTLTAEPLVMRELVILFGSESAPLFARLAILSPEVQQFIIDKLKRRIVGLSIRKWRQRESLVETYEEIYPIQRGLYSHISSVNKALFAIQNVRGYNNIKINLDSLPLLYAFIKMYNLNAEKSIATIKRFFEASNIIENEKPVTYDQAEILVASGFVLTFISDSIKIIERKKSSSYILHKQDKEHSSGIHLASEIGLTSAFKDSERFVNSYVKSCQIKEMSDGPRLLFGIYGISDHSSSYGIAWGKTLASLIQSYERTEEIPGGIETLLNCTIFQNILSFHFAHHDEVLIKISVKNNSE